MNKTKYIILFLIIVALGIIFFVSRSARNEKISEVNPVTVSTLSVTDVIYPAGTVLAGAKTIKWQTMNYPNDAGVNINLIRKISDSPRGFAIVRTLETNTPNDGEQAWVPQSGEISAGLYVEVTCSNSYQFQAGCSLSSEPIKVN
jgi:hypothetical protein